MIAQVIFVWYICIRSLNDITYVGTIQIPFTIKVKRLYHILFALTFKLLRVPRFHRTKSYFTLPPTPGTAGFIFIFFCHWFRRIRGTIWNMFFRWWWHTWWMHRCCLWCVWLMRIPNFFVIPINNPDTWQSACRECSWKCREWLK